MIAMIVTGVGFIAVVAIVVGIMDAAQASAWRRIAAERRMRWEARRPEFHGVDSADTDTWDDD
jgi:hypothetical protein